MTTQKGKMICPACGDEMNHHADKLVYPATLDDVRNVNATLGGLVEEIHCCPGCGAAESRRAE
jgi:predicted RNA-binding Zn-ribbon protein involved in translation (DUF1610 family)